MSGVRTFGNGSLWSIYNSDCAFTWLRLAFVCVRLCFESIFVLLVKLNPILVWIRTTRSIVMHDLYPNSYIPFNRIFIRDCNHSTLRLIYITHILTNNLNRIKMKPQQHKQIAGIQFKPVRISLLLLSFFLTFSLLNIVLKTPKVTRSELVVKDCEEDLKVGDDYILLFHVIINTHIENKYNEKRKWRRSQYKMLLTVSEWLICSDKRSRFMCSSRLCGPSRFVFAVVSSFNLIRLQLFNIVVVVFVVRSCIRSSSAHQLASHCERCQTAYLYII